MLEAVSAAIAAALAPVKAAFPDMQIDQYMNQSPAASPSIDIYPDTPFRSGEAEGMGDDQDTYWLVRARQTTVDHQAAQQVLLKLLDRGNPESIQDALEADQSLGGVAQAVAVIPDAVSGYTEYIDDIQTGGRYIGVQMRVRVITKTGGVG